MLLIAAAACGGGRAAGDGATGSGDVPELEGFASTRLDVGGTTFAVWLAESPAQQSRGLMGVTAAQLAPLDDGTPRGMLFVFVYDARLSFWMRDTAEALDLAYVDARGRIAELHPLEPYDETRVVSAVPVRYALETARGTLAAHAIGVGDLVELPAPTR
jgi:uncharacterized membrane protein (UPF0127 family)